jgi:hypothetical protein
LEESTILADEDAQGQHDETLDGRPTLNQSCATRTNTPSNIGFMGRDNILYPDTDFPRHNHYTEFEYVDGMDSAFKSISAFIERELSYPSVNYRSGPLMPVDNVACGLNHGILIISRRLCQWFSLSHGEYEVLYFLMKCFEMTNFLAIHQCFTVQNFPSSCNIPSIYTTPTPITTFGISSDLT